MGHKVHPTGFRLGVIRDWQAKWYADRHYREFLQEDLELRDVVGSMYPEAGVSLVEIDRQANNVSMTIHTARPGILIGRGGQRVDELRARLENMVGKRVQLNIREVPQPELDAQLVARNVAEQIARRVAYRRALQQALQRSMQAGAHGMRISIAGRLGGAEIARRVTMHEGQVPLHTLRADIDYGQTEAHTNMGRIGVKVWIYRGDILPEPKAVEEEALPEPWAAPEPEAAVPEATGKAEGTPVAEAENEPASPQTGTEAAAETPAEPVSEAAGETQPAAEMPEDTAGEESTGDQGVVTEPGETSATTEGEDIAGEPVAAPEASVEEEESDATA